MHLMLRDSCQFDKGSVLVWEDENICCILVSQLDVTRFVFSIAWPFATTVHVEQRFNDDIHVFITI